MTKLVRTRRPDIVEAADFWVLLKLADVCQSPLGENVFPSVRSIAAWCALSERTVIRKLANLVRYGVIEVTAPSTPTFPTTYRIRVEMLQGTDTVSVLPGDTVSPGDLINGVTDEPDGVTGMSVGTDSVSPRTCIELTNELAAAAEPVESREPNTEPFAACITVDEVLTEYAAQRQREEVAKFNRPKNPPGFRRSIIADHRVTHGEAIATYIASNPAATAGEVIDVVIREKKGSRMAQYNATQLDLALQRAASTALIGAPIDGLMQWLDEVNATDSIRTCAVDEYHRALRGDPF